MSDQTPQIPKFPTMLRKMWSGAEVQQWIDENIAPLLEATPTSTGAELKHGCYCDLEPHMEPDGCVIDEGKPDNCFYANGKTCKTQCEYWKPITRENNIAAGVAPYAGLTHPPAQDEAVRRDAERQIIERCAALCDELDHDENTDDYRHAARWCAERIRMMGAMWTQPSTQPSPSAGRVGSERQDRRNAAPRGEDAEAAHG